MFLAGCPWCRVRTARQIIEAFPGQFWKISRSANGPSCFSSLCTVSYSVWSMREPDWWTGLGPYHIYIFSNNRYFILILLISHRQPHLPHSLQSSSIFPAGVHPLSVLLPKGLQCLFLPPDIRGWGRVLVSVNVMFHRFSRERRPRWQKTRFFFIQQNRSRIIWWWWSICSHLL